MLLLNFAFADAEDFKNQDLYLFGGVAFLIVLITLKVKKHLKKKKGKDLSKEELLSKKEELDNKLETLYNFTWYVSFTFFLSYSYVKRDLKAIGDDMYLLGMVALIALTVVYFVVFIKDNKKTSS